MIVSIIGIIIAMATLNGIAVALTTKRAARCWHAVRTAVAGRMGRDYPATWSEPPIMATRYAGRTWYAPPF